MINFFKNNETIPLNKTLYSGDLSKALVRGNALLAGNVKIVIDSNDDIWLNSIPANEDLERIEFQKYKISANSFYPVDIKNFFNRGKLDSKIVYDVPNLILNDYSSNRNDHHQEFDDLYISGASYLSSKLYNEAYSYFAPIWVDKILPEHFIILKIKESENDSTWETISKKSKIIKSFSLKEDSNIGKYIRKIYNSKEYKESPLYVEYNESKLSEYNGILWDKGILGTKGEYHSDFWKSERTFIESNEWIINGFKRNNILSSNLLHLEFLFNDDEDIWEKYNYIGLYVSENTLKDLNTFDKNNQYYFYQFNNGIYDSNKIISTAEKNIYLEDDYSDQINESYLNESYLKYISSKNKFYTLDSFKYENFSNKNLFNIKLKDDNININDFYSRNEILLQEKCDIYEKSRSSLSITIGSLNIGDFIELSNINESQKIRFICNNLPIVTNINSGLSFYSSSLENSSWIEINDNYINYEGYSIDYIQYYNNTSLSYYIPIYNIEYNSTTNKTKIFLKGINTLSIVSYINIFSKRYYEKNIFYNSSKNFYYSYINNLGSLDDVIYNLNGSINNSTWPLSCTSKDHEITIFANNSGSSGNYWKVRIKASSFLGYSTFDGKDYAKNIQIEAQNISNGSLWSYYNGKEYSLNGGCDNKNFIVISEEVKNKIPIEGYFSTNNGWEKPKSISRYIDDQIIWNDDQIEKISKFNYYVLSFNDEIYLNSFKYFNVYSKTKIKIGAFSIFPLVDWDWCNKREIASIHPELKYLFNNIKKYEILQNNLLYRTENISNLYHIVPLLSYVLNTNIVVDNDMEIEFAITGNENFDYFNYVSIYYVDSLSFNKVLSYKIKRWYQNLGNNYIVIEDNNNELKNSINIISIEFLSNVFSTSNTMFQISNTGLWALDNESYIDFSIDYDIMNWNGFDNIQDYLNSDDESNINNLLSISGKSITEIISDKKKHFTYKLLSSPYAKTREIWTKENSIKNIINSSIFNWTNNSDTGNSMPYYLNNSASFNNTNYSVNSNFKNYDFSYFLIQCPYYSNDYINHYDKWLYLYNENIHDNCINLNGSNLNIDYVLSDDYTTLLYNSSNSLLINNSILNNKLIPIKEKYSKFKLGKNGKLYTIFLGNKIEITNDSLKWLDWTFSISVMKSFSIVKTPFEWKICEYEDSNHIHFYIYVNLIDYRAISSNDEIFFNSNTSNKFINNYIMDVNPHTLSSPLTLGPLSYVNGLENWITINPYKLYYPDGEEIIPFKTNLYEEILLNDDGTFYNTNLSVSLPNSDNKFRSMRIYSSNYDIELTNFKEFINDTTLSFPINKIYASPSNLNSWSSINIPFYNDSYYNNSSTLYLSKSKNINRNLLNRISYTNVKKMLDNNDSQIQKWKYKNYISSKSDINLKFIDPDVISLDYENIIKIDDNKPEIHNNKQIIGFNIEKKEIKKNIFRHNGYYFPSFYNVLDFKYYDNILYKRNLQISNINDIFLGIIKTSKNDIIRDIDQNKFPSLYPLIDDVISDITKFNIFSRNWDKEGVKNYTSINSYEYLNEILLWKEKKRIFGSSLLLTQNEFFIYGGDWSINNNEVILDLEPAIKKYIFDNTSHIWNDLLNKNKILNLSDWENYWNYNLSNLYDINTLEIYQNSKSDLWGNNSGLLSWKETNWNKINLNMIPISKWKRKIENWNSDSSLTIYVKIKRI